MNTDELPALLADVAEAGIYFIDERDGEAMVQAGTALEFAVARIDLAGCGDKTQALARFAGALHFPDWFGGNWDALADSLADLSWWPAPGHVLLIERSDDWRRAAGDEFDTALDILDEAAAGWGERGVPFWVLLPLPAEQLALLDD